MAGGGGIPVPTPVVAADLIYLTSNHRPVEPSHPLSPIFVVRTSATGDLGVPSVDDPGEHLAWMQTRHGTYMQTPLVYRGLAYFGKDNGVVRAFDAATGKLKGTVRLGGGNMGFSASPVAGDGKLYFTAEPGYVFVLSADETMETLEMNWMDEILHGHPRDLERGARHPDPRPRGRRRAGRRRLVAARGESAFEPRRGPRGRDRGARSQA